MIASSSGKATVSASKTAAEWMPCPRSSRQRALLLFAPDIPALGELRQPDRRCSSTLRASAEAICGAERADLAPYRQRYRVELAKLHALKVHLDDRLGASQCQCGLQNDEPSAMIRSASFMNQLAIGVPERPSTPAAFGWASGIKALAFERRCNIGAPSFSARAITASRLRNGAVSHDDERALGSVDQIKRQPYRQIVGSAGITTFRPPGLPVDTAGLSRRLGLHIVRKDQMRDVALNDRGLAGKLTSTLRGWTVRQHRL